jgi:predicted Zn-dependent peptidase
MPGVRSIALGMWIGAGSRFEVAEHAGISHFIEHLIFKGSERYSAWDIARIFDEMGGEINAATSKEYTIVHARFLDEQLETAFSVMADMVRRPLFAELDQEREVVLEEVAMYEDSPQELVHDLLSEAVFDSHPLGRPVIGRADSLRATGEAEVRAYHASHYVNPAIVVAAAGNIEHARLCELAVHHLAGGAGASATPPALVRAHPQLRHVAGFREKETEQYHICLGGLGPARDDPRRFVLSVLDIAIGGSSSSRLFQEVREKRGLAYSVYSYTSLYADTGLVAVYVGSRQEALGEAMDVIREELGRAAELPETEVERAKAHLKGQMVLSMESPQARMHQLGRSVLTGIEILSLDELLARVGAVTYEEALELAAQVYDVDRWSGVCIGPDTGSFKATVPDFGWEGA